MKRPLLAPSLLLLLAVACGDDSSSNPVPSVSLLADTNRNGKIDENDPSERKDHGTWDATQGAIFLANIDDDLGKCPKTGKPADELAKCNDAQDAVVNGDDDLLDMAPLKIAAWGSAPAGAAGTLTISDSAQARVRLFRMVGDAWEAFDPADTTFTTDEIKKGIDLRIEGRDIVRDAAVWDGLVEISLDISAGGKSLGSDLVALHIAPMIFPSHLNAPELLYASNLQDTDSSNFQSALTSFSKTLELPAAKGLDHDDIWAQDYFETAYMQMPGADGPHNIHVFLRSANYGDAWGDTGPAFREAGNVVFSTLRGPDAAALVSFDPKHEDQMDSLNSFGNLETIPPYVNGDKKYPLGRVIRGHTAKFHPDFTFEKMVESQGVQPPVYVDTSWLLVAHIDEVISFAPNDTKRGWSLFYADPTKAKQMFDELKTSGKGTTPLHEGVYWRNDAGKPVDAKITVEGVLADEDVMATSQKAALKVKEIIDILKSEVGLTDEETGSVPFLFTSIQGEAIAYQPGMVNGVSVGKGHFAAPKPHGPVIGGKDIFEKAFEDSAAAHGTTIQWIEDWDLLHINEGEVHCGSNVLRTPPAQGYWKVGQ